MPKTKWIMRGVAAVWVVVAACTKDDAQAPRGVAAPPEIGWSELAEPAERAPISLTASDGSGLRLISLDVRTVIEDPLAFTELHLVFNNPEPRRREGRFEITLPPQAAISRFAMRVAAGFQEGEIVERRRAQQVYEDFLHRKQDPALLEKDAGNEFAARVFPIEANANKEIIIAYSEELARRDTPYRLMLQGLPKLDQLSVDVRVGSSSATGNESTERARSSSGRLKLQQRDYVPAADLVVRLPRQKPVALRNGSLVVARVAPVLNLPPAAIDGLTVLFDTSASRALGFGAQIERLGRLFAELKQRGGKDIDVRVVAFDQTTEEVYRGAASGFGLRDKGKLLARDALGASDLAQALAHLASQPSAHDRILLVSDGVITAGAQDTTALREAVARLAAHGVKRLDVLAEGGIQDRDTLAALTRAGLASSGVVLDASGTASQLADKLLKATRDRIEVQISGASWVYPGVLEGVQPGDERLVFAELPAETPLQIELVGAGAEAVETMEVPRPLLERAWANAKIAASTAALRALSPEAARERAAQEQAIVALSIQHRVVSDYTALLVLETEQDYQRFGIEQNALTSILRVGDEGIELFDRKQQVAAQIAEESDKFRQREALEAPAAAVPEGAAVEPTAALRAEPSSGRADRPTRDDSPALGSLRERKGTTTERRSELASPAPAPLEQPPLEQPKDELARAKPAAAPAASSGGPPGAQGLSRGAPAPASPAKASRASADFGAEAEASLGTASGAGNAQPARPAASLDTGAPRVQVASPALEARVVPRVQSSSGMAQALATQVLRSALVPRARQCYALGELRDAPERLSFVLAISDKGSVSDAFIRGGSLADRAAQTCIVAALRTLRFPKPDAGQASVEASLDLSMQPASIQLAASPSPRPRPAAARVPTPAIDEAYSGALAEVFAALKRGDNAGASSLAAAAHAQDPGDVIGLIALGEALEAQRDFGRAARVYGSLIDLFPSRADLRRMAGARLERLPGIGQVLAVDTYRRAVEQRPDQPAGHRALAYALLKQSDRAAAFETLDRALDRNYGAERFEGVERILREDLALVGAAWVRADPAAQGRVSEVLTARGIEPDRAPSTRFVLSWETDANDVDFHLYDGSGGHAYYMKRKLASGGALYADITTGYGPECFAIPGRARGYPYVLQAHYYARGPMGYGMGKLQVVEYDGAGGLKFAEHPFVIMKDKAFIELARLDGPLPG